MKTTRTLNFTKIIFCLVLMVGLGASASASCGDSMSALAAAAAVARSQPHSTQPNSAPERTTSAKTSIVGMWHIRFVVGDNTIQEAYQI